MASVRDAMTQFWEGMAEECTFVEMMHDTQAEQLAKEDTPEILSYLPDYTEKTVLELAAGIGRFTPEIAKASKKVIAVDFIEAFIEKNKKTNQHLGNIEFVVADVTKLELPEESVDFVFSNWLLMYLNDEEVQELFRKQLKWLRPGGFIFFRESCRKPCGDIVKTEDSSNPAYYREPEMYEAFYSSTSIPLDAQNVYGFDIVLSKPVETYMKRKNNSNQLVWLLQKVEKDISKIGGYSSFQGFLDNQQYCVKNILMLEKVFGRNFISTGGLEATQEFVKLLNLQRGQRVLDVGGGIGGNAFYMAKNFGVQVVCNDLSSNMIKLALERAQQAGCGPDQIVFETADATKRDYATESFDVVYSRGAILHMEDKLSLFRKFYKFLKPGGKVLISDYCCSAREHSEKFKTYVRKRGYILVSPPDYGKLLEQAGFVNVRVEDISTQFADVLRKDISRTEGTKDEFIKEFDEQGYNYIIEIWHEKLAVTELGDHKWGLFYAEKP